MCNVKVRNVFPKDDIDDLNNLLDVFEEQGNTNDEECTEESCPLFDGKNWIKN